MCVVSLKMIDPSLFAKIASTIPQKGKRKWTWMRQANLADLPEFTTEEISRALKYVDTFALRTIPSGFVCMLFGITREHLNLHIGRLEIEDRTMLCPADITIITLRLTGEAPTSRIEEHIKGVSDLFYSCTELSTETD